MKLQLNDIKKMSLYIILMTVLIALVILAVVNIETVYAFSKTVLSRLMALASPILIGLIVAYLLDPLVSFYHSKVVLIKKKDNKRRFFATGLTFITVVGIFVLAGFAISYSLRGGDGFRLLNNLSKAIEDFTGNFLNLSDIMKDRVTDFSTLWQGEELAEDFIAIMTRIVQQAGGQIVGYLSRLGGYFLNIFVGLAISFYFLMDKEIMLREWSRFRQLILSEKRNQQLENIWKQGDWVLSGYIRGQLIDVLIMGVLISITLLILGIDYAIIIGIISGFANLIPMVGSTVATIVAVLVALAGDTPIKALYALIVLIILQQIDGNIIVPKVVGKSVNLHPVMVLLALFIFGSLFGILGMLVAVPTTALLKHFYSVYVDGKIDQEEAQ
jgi:predicted PurR-regulated permease PerM